VSDTVAELFETDTRSPTRTVIAAPSTPVALRQAMDGVFAHVLALIDTRRAIVVHVTASTAGEGTSTVARHLAAAAARTDWCRTVLIDARAGGAPWGAGTAGPHDAVPALLDRAPGEGGLPLRRMMIDGVAVDAGVLQGSRGTPSIERVRALLGTLRATYTLTVIDCPPVTIAPETAAMSRLADGVVLVVGAEQVKTGTVVQARMQLEQFGATLLGVVFNRRRERLPRLLRRWF
jgi:Mrp family chromosome partitioning ATPase